MVKEKTCKICKSKFKPMYRATERVCSVECAITEAKNKRIEKERREWRAKKKKLKEAIKTKSDWEKDLQKIFNKFIRLRDKNKPCISCGKIGGARDAGHYRSVGANPELRFNEDNCHSQCVACNQHLHGNLINYRKGLIKRRGELVVDRLEGEQKPLKLEIEDIKKLIKAYRAKVKGLERGDIFYLKNE